ncbi:pre-rRNA-processing protein pno1, partial [Modicella reniformis]
MSSLASYKGPKPVVKPTTRNNIDDDEEDDVLISADTLPEHGDATGHATGAEDMDMETADKPKFAALKANEMTSKGKLEHRKIPIPPNRMTPLKNDWLKIYTPLVEYLKLQVRMNLKSKSVEIRTSKHTDDTGALQKGADFVKAFALGFDID